METGADLLAFIDADHLVARGWVDAARNALAAADVGAAGALYTAPPDGTWVQRAYGLLRGSTVGTADVPWLGSGNMVVRRTAFESIGGFDASLEACEDVDLCQRLRARGWRIVGDERLRSVHLGDPPTLRALFRAERWRGRNNVTVTLRGPWTPRNLASLLTPAVVLAALLALVLAPAALLAGVSPWPVYGGALLAIGGLALLKTLLAMRPGAVTPGILAQVFVVVLVYNIARAMALVTPASHHRARR
jgi:hypothetical protein